MNIGYYLYGRFIIEVVMEKYWRGQELLKDLLIIPEVQHYIAQTRKNIKEDSVWRLMYRYNIPAKFQDVVKWYLETDELDLSLTFPAVEIDQTSGVALRLSRDITKEELLDYIEESWSDELVPALEWMNDPRERIPIPYDPEADRQIYLDYLNKNQLGLNNQGVATRNNTNLSRVDRVIKRFKNLAQAR